MRAEVEGGQPAAGFLWLAGRGRLPGLAQPHNDNVPRAGGAIVIATPDGPANARETRLRDSELNDSLTFAGRFLQCVSKYN